MLIYFLIGVVLTTIGYVRDPALRSEIKQGSNWAMFLSICIAVLAWPVGLILWIQLTAKKHRLFK